MRSLECVTQAGGGEWYLAPPSPSGDFFLTKETANVFVESCCAHGAHGNGPAFSPAASPAAHRRQQRASSAKRPAQLYFQKQEVLPPRSGSSVFPHSLISSPNAPPSIASATM